MLEILFEFISERLLRLSEDSSRSDKTRIIAGIVALVLLLAALCYGIWDSWMQGYSVWAAACAVLAIFLVSLCMALAFRWLVRRHRRREREEKNKNQV